MVIASIELHTVLRIILNVNCHNLESAANSLKEFYSLPWPMDTSAVN